MRVPLRAADRSLAGLRIAHLSDLHMRRWSRVLRTARSLLRSLDYDLLAVTGDFALMPYDWKPTVQMMRAFFQPIARRRPIFATLGNHDHPGMAEASDMPIRFLRDDSVTTEFRGGQVRIAGVEQLYPGGGDVQAGLKNHPDFPTILLAHYPSTVYRLKSAGVALQLSGHTHGGQIRLPFFGCLWSNDRFPAKLASGLSQVNGIPIHVSAGIGASAPLPIRLNCPPEISILTFDSEPRTDESDGHSPTGRSAVRAVHGLPDPRDVRAVHAPRAP